MESKLELRCLASAELRASSKSRQISGYGAVFSEDSEPLPFLETIRPGAFTRVLSENPDVRYLIDHDPSLIIARTTAGTLSLSQDTRGLHFVANVPNTTIGDDLLENIRAGNITQCSFAFRVGKDAWSRDSKRREIIEVSELRDVSAVAYAAYPQTSVDVRSANGERVESFGWYLGNHRITDVSHEPTSDELERLRLRLALLKRL